MNIPKMIGCCGLSACITLSGCGRSPLSDVTGVTRAEGDDAHDSTQGELEPEDGETTSPISAVERHLRELEELPRLDVEESARIAPACQAPTSVGLSSSPLGTRAVRLLWDQETGDCILDDVDRSPEGMLGILTLRVQDEVAVLSSVGKWKFYAPPELDTSDVPLRREFTIYPYLGDWQFVATLEYNGELVELTEFAYLRGDGPLKGGERADLEDQAPSDFVPPTLCAPKPEGGEAP